MDRYENIDYIKHKYAQKKKQIQLRIQDFQNVFLLGNDAYFSEMIFCICAANSKARSAFVAQKLIEKKGIWKIDQKSISEILLKSKVRFHNNKARYIVSARAHLFLERNFDRYMKEAKNEFEMRDILAKNVLGLGMKESSHFLRNIGYSKNTAILDRHILKNLKKYSVISEIPKTLTKTRYIEIEKKMNEFSDKIEILSSHLDLLFWSEQTGEILK